MRAALLFVVFFAAMFAWTTAHAGKGSGPDDCTGLGDRCDQGEAYSALVSLIARDGPGRCAAQGRPAGSGNRIVMTGGSAGSVTGSWGGDAKCGDNAFVAVGFKYWGAACPAGTAWDDPTKSCKDMRCSDAPPIPTYPFKEGWFSCQSYNDTNGAYSCETVAVRQLPNQEWAGYVAWSPTGGKCDPNNFTCPTGYVKAPDGTCEPVPECPPGVPRDAAGECMQPAECPQGKMKDANGVCVPEKNLCPVGQVKGPDGSCIEDSGQCKAGTVMGDDGTCKPDSDGDGEPDPDPNPDEEDEHKAEDSPRCDVAPKCSGDEIMCLHAKQLWRIDCNTRKARQVDMDAYCKRPPVCESVALGDEARNAACDAVEEAALIQQWKTACATAQLVDIMSKGGATNGDVGTHARLDAIRNYLTGNGQQLDQPEVPFTEQPIESQEWSSGLSGTGTCPAPISTTITVAGFSAPVNFSFDPLCQFAGYLYAVVVTMGGLMAAFIIAGVRK